MQRKQIGIFDVDGTIVGSSACAATPHRNHPELLKFLAEKKLDGIYIATHRRFTSNSSRETYAERLLQYAKVADIHDTPNATAVTIRSNEKEFPAERSWFKSGLMSHTIRILCDALEVPLLGISMTQDLSCKGSTGLGYTYATHAEPYEQQILKMIESGATVIDLPKEATLDTSSKPPEFTKNGQIMNIMRALADDVDGADVIFIDDQQKICQAAEDLFTDPRVVDPKRFSFKAFCIYSDGLLSIAEINRMKAEKLKNTPQETLSDLSQKQFNTLDKDQEFSLHLSTTHSTGNSASRCSTEDDLFNSLKLMKLSRRPAGFFSKTAITIQLQGVVNKKRVDEKFFSVNDFEQFLNREFAFSIIRKNVSFPEHLFKWQNEVDFAHMSETRHIFLERMLELFETLDKTLPYTTKAAVLNVIYDILVDSLIPGDDAFFDATLNRVRDHNLLKTSLPAEINELIILVRHAQTQLRLKIQGALIALMLLNCYVKPEIFIPITALLITGHYLNLYSLETISNDMMEKIETCQKMRM